MSTAGPPVPFFVVEDMLFTLPAAWTVADLGLLSPGQEGHRVFYPGRQIIFVHTGGNEQRGGDQYRGHRLGPLPKPEEPQVTIRAGTPKHGFRGEARTVKAMLPNSF